MSKGGLIFAGASQTLKNRFFDENLYDGVLSAAELAQQDLSNTELMVLSACQTGQGHITEDGIYGILRGLKQAGAQAMILSLWSVDDQSTNLLMTYFYEALEQQKEKDIHAAFLSARKRIMTEEQSVYKFDPFTLTIKETKYHYDQPMYINPFIIIDAY